MRRLFSWFLCFACLGIHALSAAAQDSKACLNTPATEQRIEACSKMLAAPNLSVADRVNAYLQRGRGYNLVRGDFERGIADASEAIKLDPKSAPAYGLRGATLAAAGKYDAALPDLNRGLQLDRNAGGVRNGFGIYYLGKGDHERALAEFTEAIRLLPNFSGVFRGRGAVYEARGEFLKAMEDYRAAIHIEPAKSIVPTREAVEALARLEKKVAAIPDWQACLNAQNAEPRIAACTRLIGSKQISGSDLAQAYLFRANTLGSLHGACDAAISDYSETLKLSPGNVVALSVRGICFARKGNFPLALADINAARKIDVNNAVVRNAFGFYYNAIGDYDNALVELNEAIRLNPNGPAQLRNRGVTFEKKGEFPAALADYRQVLKIDPQAQLFATRDANEAIARIQARLSNAPAAAAPATAPQRVSIPAQAVVPGKRIALVIGNDKYEKLPALQKAVNDAQAVAGRLKALGFDVIVIENATRRAMSEKIAELTAKIGKGDTAFVFYAGHGVSIKDGNYLMPVDTPNVTEGQESLIAREGFAADGIIDALQERGARVTVLVLDACRENPFKRAGTRAVGGSRGLGDMRAPEGVFVLYSAGFGQAALDRLSDRDTNPNSVFTRTFVALLGKPGLSLQEIAKAAQSEVKKLSASVNHTQMPAYYDQIDGALSLGAN